MAKARRTFTPEFKAQAVKLVTERGFSFVEAAHDLGVGESTVVERVDTEEDLDGGSPGGLLVVLYVRPSKGARRRCGRCGRRCAGYDSGRGRRRWRAS